VANSLPNTPCRFRNWFRNSASVLGDPAFEQVEGLIDDVDLFAAYLLARMSGDQLVDGDARHDRDGGRDQPEARQRSGRLRRFSRS
jgi:hypothetical protein